MMRKTAGRLWIAIAVLGYVLFLGACDESHDIIVNTGQENEPPLNEPPLVVTQGPEFPLGTIEVSNNAGFGTPFPWVVVGDPNGLDDISAVLFYVESIRIHEVIIRPESMGSGCVVVLYEPDSVIDITSLIPVPVDIPGFTARPMFFNGGGVYSIFTFSAPSIASNFDHFVRATGCVSGGGGFLQWLLLSPPAVPTATNVFLTYLDAEFIGISVTVYDKVGASATTTFPDLRVVYVTTKEKTVSP